MRNFLTTERNNKIAPSGTFHVHSESLRRVDNPLQEFARPLADPSCQEQFIVHYMIGLDQHMKLAFLACPVPRLTRISMQSNVSRGRSTTLLTIDGSVR